jgi:hypothetical protein
VTIDQLPDVQFLAATNLLKSYVSANHEVIELRVTPSFAGKHVYVYCVAAFTGEGANDDITTAGRFARSGFHVQIGARGAIKHIK